MASGPITSWQIDEETVETVTDFILGGSKITADGDCSHEIKRHLLLGRKVRNNVSLSELWELVMPSNHLSHPYMTIVKTITLTRWTFVGKVMSLLFNMVSRLIITFSSKE